MVKQLSTDQSLHRVVSLFQINALPLDQTANDAVGHIVDKDSVVVMLKVALVGSTAAMGFSVVPAVQS